MLKSRDNSLELYLELQALDASSHSGWHTYRMEFRTHGETNFVFESSEDSPLYLDCIVEPEIPMICAGMRKAIVDGTRFDFEPIDERDFHLTIDCTNENVIVRVSFANISPPSDFRWSEGVEVSREDIQEFVEALELQYSSLIA